MSDVDIRPVAIEERRRAVDAFRTALLNGPVGDEAFERRSASWDGSDSLAAWDGDRCVGVAAAFRFDSTVPGGARIPTAGVTRVGVIPTHTRRGVLTQLMQRLLVESHERGNVLATLHASETTIYRRFGFGLGTDASAAVITTRAATPWRTPSIPGSVRLLHHAEVLDVVPDLYERVARWRVGSISRPDWMWSWVLKDAGQPAENDGKGSFVAVHTDADGNDDGYVSYEVAWDESFAANPVGAGKVLDLWGASPTIELELWRFLLGIDLVVRWQAEMRPVDEPVRRAMHDARAYEVEQRIDDQWVRILDVDAALGARSYAPSATAVAIEVRDPLFRANCGTWTVSAEGSTRSDGTAADVCVDIGTLSTAYLGAVSWCDLATIGAVTAPDDAIDHLDTLFAVRPTPFCGTGY
jgi:predicted acetyltransferase